MNNSVVFSIFTELCGHHHTQLENLFIAFTLKNLYPFGVSPVSLKPPAPGSCWRTLSVPVIALAELGLCCCAGFCAQGRSSAAVCALPIAGASRGGAQAEEMWFTGLVVPRHMGSFLSRDQTRVCYRLILYHWTTREAPPFCLFVLVWSSHMHGILQ